MELTGRDVHALVLDLQPAVDGKVQKVYGTDRFALVLDLYARDLEYRYLYVELPSLVFASNEKVEMPRQPPGLAQRIRGQLQGLKIASIEQHGMDRILMIRLVGRKEYTLVVELFSKGNVIVLDEHGVIRNLAVKESYGSRDVRPGAEYVFPPTNDLDLEKPLRDSIPEDKHVVARIASAGFGGHVAERVLAPFVDDVSSATLADLEDPGSLREALIAERDATLFTIENGRIVRDEDGLPILELLEKAADLEPARDEREQRSEKRASKADKAIDIQSKRLDSLKDRREDDLRRGELIFEHYQLIDEVLSFCREYRARRGSLEGLDEHWPDRFPKLDSFEKKGVRVTLDVESVK